MNLLARLIRKKPKTNEEKIEKHRQKILTNYQEKLEKHRKTILSICGEDGSARIEIGKFDGKFFPIHTNLPVRVGVIATANVTIKEDVIELEELAMETDDLVAIAYLDVLFDINTQEI